MKNPISNKKRKKAGVCRPILGGSEALCVSTRPIAQILQNVSGRGNTPRPSAQKVGGVWPKPKQWLAAGGAVVPEEAGGCGVGGEHPLWGLRSQAKEWRFFPPKSCKDPSEFLAGHGQFMFTVSKTRSPSGDVVSKSGPGRCQHCCQGEAMVLGTRVLKPW